MLTLPLVVLSAFISLILVNFIFLKIYENKGRNIYPLLISPIVLVISLYITDFIQTRIGWKYDTNRLNILLLFFVILIVDAPFTISGYEVIPDISKGERLIVSGIEGISSYLIALAILLFFDGVF
jgi:hypothetical protein